MKKFLCLMLMGLISQKNSTLLHFTHDEKTTIATNNCLALVPGAHISCDDPVIPNAITTTTGRCFPGQNGHPGYCIKCSEIIPVSPTSTIKATKKCAVLDFNGKPLSPD